MEEPRVHPLDYLSVLRRRRRWLVVPFVLAIAVGGALALWLPREYLSRATIGVAAAEISPELARSAALGKDERVRAFSQQLLSRPVLERVAREENLVTDGASLEEVVARLRQNMLPVTLPDQIAPDNNGPRLDMFVISYVDRAPETAQRVTQRLADVFVDETSRAREVRAEGTSDFLSTQVQVSQARLAELESRLRDAKKQNMGRLPEQSSANLQTLSGLRQQLEANNNALRGEQDRLSMIERQLEGMRQGLDALPMIKTTEQPQSAQERAVDIERQLTQARMAYTDKHPEVVRLQEELQAAKRAAAVEKAQPAEDRLAHLKANPAYRQLLADQELGRLRVRELQRAETQTRAQINEYQARVEAAPLVEQQLASLQREYDLQKTQYSDLVAKRQQAAVSEDLERRRAGERFQVFGAATWPKTPYKPNLLRIMLGAVMAGLFLGGLAAIGREFLDRSVHDARTLQQDYDLPVLGEISRIRAA
jgi:polysaccharide chain length determinant protein (PEP-CTERM system associated)